MSIFLLEFIRDQAKRLALSNIGEVVSVFKDKREFNRKISNLKSHVKIFPVRGDPVILPRKVSFYGSIQKESFCGKSGVVLQV